MERVRLRKGGGSLESIFRAAAAASCTLLQGGLRLATYRALTQPLHCVIRTESIMQKSYAAHSKFSRAVALALGLVAAAMISWPVAAKGPGIGASCWCEMACTSSDGKSFSPGTDFSGYIQGIPGERGRCEAACTTWAQNNLSAWAEANKVCGRLTCTGTSHVGSEKRNHYRDIGPLTADRTCELCPDPQAINLTVNSNPPDVIPGEIPTVLQGLPLASFHETNNDRIFIGAVRWDLPANSCCQLTGTVTVVLRALYGDLTNDHVGIGLPGGGIGASQPVVSNTVTLNLTPDIISSGHVTIWAQDDHSVESITVNIKGCCLTPNVETPPPTKVVFATSTKYASTFGGAIAADAFCSQAAANAGLSGSFLSWVSDSIGLGHSPSARFTKSTGPYVCTDGVVVANDWTDLTSGTLRSPIDCDEFGNPVIPFPTALGYSVWTGTNPDGTPAPSSCLNWTAGDPEVGVVGIAELTDAGWTSRFNANCGSIVGGVAAFYCFEQ